MPKTHTSPLEIQTLEGFFNVFEPSPEDITLASISIPLSRIVRFNGHTSRPYTVAEHSIRCFNLAALHTDNPRLLLHVLLHDAPEAFLGDYPGPHTRRLYFVDKGETPPLSWKYEEIEGRVLWAIYSALLPEGFRPPSPDEAAFVRRIDLSLLAWERDSCFPERREWLPLPGEAEGNLLAYGASFWAGSIFAVGALRVEFEETFATLKQGLAGNGNS